MNLLKVIKTGIVVSLLAPFTFYLFKCPNEQERLDTIIARLTVLEAKCTEPKLKDVLQYTIRRYNYVGRTGVNVQPLPGDVAGLNPPWVPGVLIDDGVWKDDDQALITLVHEAMHDYYPWFGHYHMYGTVPAQGYKGITELERLMWEQ